MRERPLVIFTLLAQMAVGAFLALGALDVLFGRQPPTGPLVSAIDLALLGIGLLVGAAVLASLFHLGAPFRAFRAVANLRSSWLSREILFTLLFVSLGAVFAAMRWLSLSSPTSRGLTASAAALAGLALVFSMGRLYMLPAVPAWSGRRTLFSFFAASFLLGSLGVGSALVFLAPAAPNIWPAARLAGAIALFSLAVELGLTLVPAASGDSPRLEPAAELPWLLILFILTLLAVVLFGSRPLLARQLLWMAFGLALIYETFARRRFYALHAGPLSN